MKNKEEIIIDGVNVAECRHFWNKQEAIKLELCRVNFANNYFSNGIPVAEKCKKHPDCYFKQLKRLKQENEELKQERLEVARLFDKTCRCDDLQEGTAKCQYFNDDCISIRHCMKKFRSLKDSYKQALEEIREILMCKIYGLNENASQLDYMCYVLDKFEKIRIKILTKINEALNGRD